MDELRCEYCDYEFTDEEIKEGDRHTALATVELRCPKCFTYNTISFRDIMNKEASDGK